MKETLIGEEITLVTGAGEELLELLLSAGRALLQAAEAESSDMPGLEGKLRAAMGELASAEGPPLTARVVIVRDGLEIHLSSSASPTPGITVSCAA